VNPSRGPAGQGRPARGSGVCRVFADRRLRGAQVLAPLGASLCRPVKRAPAQAEDATRDGG